MTVAALEAVALRKLLRNYGSARSHPPQLCGDYFQEVKRVIDRAWAMAAGGDLNYRGAEGQRPLGSKLARLYMKQVLGLCAYDPEVARDWMCVAGMLKGPESLFQPRIALRVLRHAFTGPSRSLHNGGTTGAN
jgi:hypothetical protein